MKGIKVALLSSGLWLSACQMPIPAADLVIVGGSLYQQPHTALAVRQGLITAVGNDAEISVHIGKQTQVIQLQGQSVVPGFIDSHIHTIEGAMADLACSLDDELLSAAELATKIQDCATKQQDQLWVEVVNVRSAGTDLTSSQLDQILPDRPLYLYSTDGHTAWANSRAMQIAGISAQTQDPAHGRLVRNATGQPTGAFLDAATKLISQHLPEKSAQQLDQALLQVLHKLNQAGITGMMEANSDATTVAAFCRLSQNQLLPLRVSLALGTNGENSPTEWQRLQLLRQQAKSCGLVADTIKLYADGVMEAPTQTAALLAPYHSEPAHKGTLYYSDLQMHELVLAAVAHDFSVHIHAIGDAAVRQSLQAFGAARQQGATQRFSLAHLQLIDPADYPLFARYQVIASVQWLWAQPDEYSVEAIAPFIGTQRHQGLYPAQSLIQAGAVIAGGSDWNVSDYNPLAAMAVATSRLNFNEPARPPLNANERVQLSDMIRAYTVNSALLAGFAKDTAQLKPGAVADLVILNQAIPSTIAGRAMLNVKPYYVIFAGKIR